MFPVGICAKDPWSIKIIFYYSFLIYDILASVSILPLLLVCDYCLPTHLDPLLLCFPSENAGLPGRSAKHSITSDNVTRHHPHSKAGWGKVNFFFFNSTYHITLKIFSLFLLKHRYTYMQWNMIISTLYFPLQHTPCSLQSHYQFEVLYFFIAY